MAVVHLNPIAELEAATLGSPKQPEAAGEQVVRLGGAAAGTQAPAQPSENGLGEPDEVLCAQVIQLQKPKG